MKINRALNVTIPIKRNDGVVVHAHSTPISREVFENYYLLVARTFSRIYENGLSRTSGPSIAALMLAEIAREMNIWEGPGGAQLGLIGEIHRLTNVLVPGGQGWEMLPLHEAVAKGHLDEEDLSEVDNALVFFTVVFFIHKKTDREPILRAVLPLWDAAISLLNCTAFAASLPTLTQGANTGETQQAPPAPPPQPGGSFVPS